jgi:hypothetical protein
VKLDFFIVAEAAFGHEGRLYIHGSLTNVAPPMMPWIHPQLALVLRIEVAPEDEGLDHTIGVRFVDAAGEDVIPGVQVGVPAKGIPERLPDRPVHLHAALTVASVPFQASGPYDFVAEIDGAEAGRERIYVHPAPDATPFA